jgi:hypothetical protein
MCGSQGSDDGAAGARQSDAVVRAATATRARAETVPRRRRHRDTGTTLAPRITSIVGFPNTNTQRQRGAATEDVASHGNVRALNRLNASRAGGTAGLSQRRFPARC